MPFCSVQRPNGSWTGIMGELAADNDTDFTLVLTMLHNRAGDIRYTRIYAIDTFVFVTGLAQPVPQWLSIFRPFRSESVATAADRGLDQYRPNLILGGQAV